MNIGDIIFQLVMFLIVLLSLVSIGGIVRLLITKQRTTVQQNSQLEQKLDRIIELLEKDKK